MQKLIVFLLLITTLLFSCEKGIFNAGDPATKEFPLTNGPFSRIEIKSIFEITLIQDTINKAVVSCGENLISDVNISISEDIIWIDHSVSYNWSRDYKKIKIDLHLITIPPLYIREPVSIVTRDTFKTNEFVLVVWGSRFADVNACIVADFCGIYMSLDDFGKYIVSGKSKRSEIYPCGSGYVDCRNLKTESCNIWQRSIANTYINVSKELTVKFNEKGNIYYSGNPDTIILINQPASGKLISYP